MPSRRWLFLLLYTASGAAALVYEITWTRLLTLTMGHTVAAASTVLAAIMGGLALGSWMGGRAVRGWTMSDTPRKATLTYAALEAVVAMAALAMPYLLAATAPLLASAYADGEAPLRFGLVRAALSMLLVGVPATAMGATFPLAVAWYAGAASEAGLLYSVNTAGAAAGALAAGFWLIPSLGLRATTWVGVALNVGAASGAAWLATRLPAPGGARPVVSTSQPPAGDRRRKTGGSVSRTVDTVAPAAPGLAMTATALSGFCALIYEVVWTRLVALTVGPTTYAFAMVVAAFIVGLALGSATGARLVRRVRRPAVWLGAMLATGAVAASVAGWFAASELPQMVAEQMAAPDAAFGPALTRQVLGIGLLLLPMTWAMGAAFPLALATAAGRDADVAGVAAHVYAANTVGAIAGSLTGGFLLLPMLGLHDSLRVTAGIGLLGASAIWAVDLRGRTVGARAGLARLAALASAAAVLWFLPPWDPQLLAAGSYKYAPYLGAADLENELRTWRLVYHADGSTATVSVREMAGQRSLVIDGKVDASNMGDMLTQRLLGRLPALLHRQPEDVLILGLGSGVTAQSALTPGVTRHTDVVEISPEVVAASAFFSKENGGVLSSPDVNLIVGDGRSHLAFTTHRYDVIVSEPSNPWMAGIAALFTREFFETARLRLRTDGVMCQWAHTYDISADDLKSIVRTFTSVFPQSTMWLVGDGDLLLIGTNGPSIESHVATLAADWRKDVTAPRLADVAVDASQMPFLLLSLLAGGPGEMQQYAGQTRVQTDDRMALEFTGPRAIYGRPVADNTVEILRLAGRLPSSPAARAVWERATADSWAAAGAMEMAAGGYGAAYDRYQRALSLDSRHPLALGGLSDAAAGAGKPNAARAWLEARIATEPGNANVQVALSRNLASGGDLDRAATVATTAMTLAPDDPVAAEQFASVLSDAGDGVRLGPLADALLLRFPERDLPRFYRARAWLLNGDAPQAIETLRPLVARRPEDVRAQNLLGIACATAGAQQCARAAFETALRTNPRDPETHVNLGVFFLQSNDPASAVDQFAVAVALDRTSAPARQGLSEAREALARRP